MNLQSFSNIMEKSTSTLLPTAKDANASLLTPENLSLLDDPYKDRKIGPRSITTNSVISTRKNGKKKIN